MKYWITGLLFLALLTLVSYVEVRPRSDLPGSMIISIRLLLLTTTLVLSLSTCIKQDKPDEPFYGVLVSKDKRMWWLRMRSGESMKPWEIERLNKNMNQGLMK